jgi:ATPase subunit of ABC transporter with duplicated ATPase domains
MAEKKKGIFQNIANAFSNKDEEAAAAKAAADKAAANKAAAASASAASDRARAAEKASAARAAASQTAANKAAADKLAAEKAAANRAAAIKAIEARAAATEAAETAAAKPKSATVAVKSLRVRKDHTVDSAVVAGLSFGEKVSIVSTWTDGKNTWAQLGPDKWAAIKYEGEEMIKLD